MSKTYRDLLHGLLETQEKTPDALDFPVTIKMDDEYYQIEDVFVHFDDENPSGEDLVEEGTPVLQVM